jgi:hypothetical protein
VPKPVLKRLYGDVKADGLADDTTSEWQAIVENSKGYVELEEFVRPLLKEQLQRTFKQEFAAQHARLQREVNSRLAKLPENRANHAPILWRKRGTHYSNYQRCSRCDGT